MYLVLVQYSKKKIYYLAITAQSMAVRNIWTDFSFTQLSA